MPVNFAAVERHQETVVAILRHVSLILLDGVEFGEGLGSHDLDTGEHHPCSTHVTTGSQVGMVSELG